MTTELNPDERQFLFEANESRKKHGEPPLTPEQEKLYLSQAGIVCHGEAMSGDKAKLYLGSLPHLTLEDIIALSERLMGRPATSKEIEEARKAFSTRLASRRGP